MKIGVDTRGQYVRINHENGYTSEYCHLARIDVSKGQRVSARQMIGPMGNTSPISIKAHVDFKIIQGSNYNNYIDPVPFLLGFKKEEPKEDIETLAKEVIAGNWGNGQERINKLTAAGDDVNAIQNKVNERMSPPVQQPQVDILDWTRRAIRGDFGNGDARQNELGSNFNEVQRQINLNYQNVTTNWDNIRLY